MERSVAWQNLARKYKDEAERLQAENAALQQKVAQLEAEKLAAVTVLHQPRKRAVGVDDIVPVQSTKRAKTATEPLPVLPSIPVSYPSSPSSTSSIESCSSTTLEVHPVQYRTAPPETSLLPNYPTESNSFVRTSITDDTDSPFERFDCGFCDDNTPCVCREILQQQVAERIGGPSHPTMKIDHIETPGITSSSTSQAQTSILDHLPAFQPAVPLRRRALNKQTIGRNSIFPIVLPSSLPPTCSGDPSNCRACASDDYGKTFCGALNDSMAASESADATITSGTTPDLSAEAQAMIPCDDAWRQLKSHPNAEPSDSKLLGEVVAMSSKRLAPAPIFGPSGSSRMLDVQSETAAGVDHKAGVREVSREAFQAALDLLDARRNFRRPDQSVAGEFP